LGRTLKRIAGTVVAAVILFFIVRSLVRGLGELDYYDLRVDGLRIAGAFIMIAILFMTYGRLWQLILSRFGYELTYGRSMRIWFLSQAGRYIPGKVWFALGRIYLCGLEGIPKTVTSVATGLELALVLGSGLMVFGLAAAASPVPGVGRYLLGLVLVPAILILVHPRTLNRALSLLRRRQVTLTIRYRDVLGILGVYALCWCVYGTGFYLAGTAVSLSGSGAPPPGGLDLVPQMIGINALSWAGGFLSVITPAGLGIREGISTVLLGGVVSEPYPALIPLVARIWVTIAEVGTIGVVLAARSRR
jgi:hypothetical protein